MELSRTPSKSIVNTYSPVSIFDIQLIKPGKINFTISKEQTLMLYVINGKIQFTEKNLLAQKGQMIYFDQNGDQLYFEVTLEKFRLGTCKILGIAKVNNEIVAEAEWMATMVERN